MIDIICRADTVLESEHIADGSKHVFHYDVLRNEILNILLQILLQFLFIFKCIKDGLESRIIYHLVDLCLFRIER